MRKRSGRPPRYAAIPNETIDDAANLDFMALSLLTVLLRHQDGWEITLAEIGERYGYGREAMANAMGLLQAARYVVKIRIMSEPGNQWSTELCVYDTPATDEEVAALLAEARRAPGVRAAQVIEPTAAAVARAAKRRAKLQPRGRQAPSVPIPRVPENPHSGVTSENDANPQVIPECRVSRLSGNPALSKKTVVQKTTKTDAPSGRDSAPDARRATTGSSARATRSGSAASRKDKPARMDKRTAAAFRTVVAALPGELRTLPRPLPKQIPARPLGELVREQLEHRTAEQLAERIARRWVTHGWAEKCHSVSSGEALRSGIGIAVELVRAPECPHPRCEDGTDVDTGAPCRACEQRRTDRRADRQAQGEDRPAPRGADGAGSAAGWFCSGRDGECRVRGIGIPAADGLCAECRAEQDEVREALAAAGFAVDVPEPIEQPA